MGLAKTIATKQQRRNTRAVDRTIFRRVVRLIAPYWLGDDDLDFIIAQFYHRYSLSMSPKSI